MCLEDVDITGASLHLFHVPSPLPMSLCTNILAKWCTFSAPLFPRAVPALLDDTLASMRYLHGAGFRKFVLSLR